MRGSAGKPGTPGRSARPITNSPGAANHSELAGLGIMLGLATALFALGGNWIDGRLGTKPLFVLIGTFLGFGGGFWSMYSRLVVRKREDEPEPDAEVDE